MHQNIKIAKQKYRKELIKTLDFNHKCYDLVRSSTSKVELQTIYIFELKKRFELIDDFCRFQKIDYSTIKNFSSILNFDDLNDALSTVDNYFNALCALSYNYEKQDSLAIKHVSLKELLCKTIWYDRNHDELEHWINEFYKYQRIDDEKLFFEVYDKGYYLTNCDEGYELYCSIKEDLTEFMKKDNLLGYKELCKKWYGDYYDEGKVKLNPVFLRDRFEEDIFSDLEVTLSYLKKANLYEKYIIKLQCAYTNNTPLIKLKNKSKKLDISKYNFPNFLVNLDLNFNLPLDVLKDEIEHIYNFIHRTNNKDYDILFEKDISSKKTKNIIQPTSNKSKALSLFREKYEDLEKKDMELKINIEHFVLKLFVFDCQLLCSTHDDIEYLLENEFLNSSISLDGEYVSKKGKIYTDMFDVIINQKYLTYTTGLNTDEILPQWCNL
jgi:hypothetical protein